jgi:hypothetical protein
VHHGHQRHRHHNPLGINKGNIALAAWGVAGGVGARALPAVIMPTQNTGVMGYVLNLASALALGFAGRMMDEMAGEGLLIGGLVSTGLRIVSDNFGSQIPGLGAYWTSYLPNLPAQSNPYGQMPDPGAVAAAAAAAAMPAKKGMSGGRFTGGRFRRM